MTPAWQPPPSFTTTAAPVLVQRDDVMIAPTSPSKGEPNQSKNNVSQPHRQLSPQRRPKSMNAAAATATISPSTNISPTRKKKSNTSKMSWAPTFVVGNDDDDDIPTRPKSVVVASTKRRYQPLLAPLQDDSPVPSHTKSPAKWQSGVFVANSFEEESSSDSSSSAHTAPPNVDDVLDSTRREWNQQMLKKTLKPYAARIMELEGSAEEDSGDLFNNDDSQPTAKIYQEMLKDESLSEREVAAFFEGMRLYQTKVKSLEAQLRVQKLQRKSSMVFAAPVARSGSILTTTTPKRASMAAFRPVASDEESKASTKVISNTATSTAKPPIRSFGDKSTRTMSIMRIENRLNAMPEDEQDKNVQRLLQELEEAEKNQKRLEKQLEAAGIKIAEDIPYDHAKQQVAVIAQRMAEIGSSDVEDKTLKEEYFKLEQEMEKYTNALQLTEEWIEEQAELEREWEASIVKDNEEALRKVRSHMPVDVQNMGEKALASLTTPNGKRLPQAIVRKIKRTNVLQLLRRDPEDIARLHPSSLENLRITGLTLTERRALYQHLITVGPRWKAQQNDPMTERKWIWYTMMRSNFKETVDAWQRHVDKYGPPGNHPYATREKPHSGCPLIGKQCPLRADKIIDYYENDYGFPDGPVYLKTEVTKSEVDNVSRAKQEALEAAREKKGNDRRDALKSHYKGKLQQLTQAVGTCEAMDTLMDDLEMIQEKHIRKELLNSKNDAAVSPEEAKREVASFDEAVNNLKVSIFNFASRSGMNLQGKRDAKSDKPDDRSMLELSLCEEVVEAVLYFFDGIEERMNILRIKDGRIKSSMQQLREVLDELHGINLKTIKTLSQDRPAPSRTLKTREAIRKQIQKELDTESGEAGAPKNSSLPPIPEGNDARKGLMAAIASKNGGDDGGRGNLMAAIAAKGKGGPAKAANDDPRSNLMAAIAAKANKSSDNNPRGGLMAAIAARGAAQ